MRYMYEWPVNHIYIYEGEVTGSGDGLDLHTCISVKA